MNMVADDSDERSNIIKSHIGRVIAGDFKADNVDVVAAIMLRDLVEFLPARVLTASNPWPLEELEH